MGQPGRHEEAANGSAGGLHIRCSFSTRIVKSFASAFARSSDDAAGEDETASFSDDLQSPSTPWDAYAHGCRTDTEATALRRLINATVAQQSGWPVLSQKRRPQLERMHPSMTKFTCKQTVLRKHSVAALLRRRSRRWRVEARRQLGANWARRMADGLALQMTRRLCESIGPRAQSNK